MIQDLQQQVSVLQQELPLGAILAPIENHLRYSQASLTASLHTPLVLSLLRSSIRPNVPEDLYALSTAWPYWPLDLVSVC